jgi:RNA polymerase sigma-70 factor (family 1)
LFNSRLIKFCVLYIHQKEASEEIVSDIFVKCWINRKSLKEVQNPESYLYVAVKNQSLNYLRNYSNIHLVQIEDTLELKFVNTYCPQKQMEKRELMFKLDQAVHSLPKQCQIVFKLIKEDGMKYKEVATILQISPRTVQTQLFRAIKKLSMALEPYLDTRRPAFKGDILIQLIIFNVFFLSL